MNNGFTGQKAMYLNAKESGLKIRATRIESKKIYKRKGKYAKSGRQGGDY